MHSLYKQKETEQGECDRESDLLKKSERLVCVCVRVCVNVFAAKKTKRYAITLATLSKT